MPEPTSTYSTIKQGLAADEVNRIVDNSATHAITRAVYIGVPDDYEFIIKGTWIEFSGCQNGTVIPIHTKGARHAVDGSAPNLNDIVFLY